MLMFKPSQNFLLLPPKIFTTTTTITNLKPHHHHHHHHVKLHFSPLKASPSDSSPLTTTTRDFLMDSGGLSYVQAIQVIRQVPTLLLDGGRKPRSVIAYFESSIGFSKTQISKAISKYPKLLVADVEKTLKPRIQLLQDFGFSNSDVAELIASRPTVLIRGVKTHLKPALELIKSFVNTDEDLIKIIKRNNTLPFSTTSRESIEPNIDVLRHHGVPDSEIVHLFLLKLTTLTSSTPERFKRIVERIVSLGFKPETRKFSIAVVVMCGLSKATWDSKIDLLKGLGWSELQILDSFRRHPRFLAYSEKKMKEGIAFFNENLNWDASVLSQHPFILSFGLKNRVIPRYAVLKCLMSKHIIKKQDMIFVSMLKFSETHFLLKYVFKYQLQLPYLYEVYEKECMLGGTEEEDNGDINRTV